MSLKAGRVGVNPADVDPINGRINPSSIEGYTKAQADAKFETLEAAAALQPITLAVPIHMLDGTRLTVETALQGLNEGKSNTGWVQKVSNKELYDADDTTILGYLDVYENVASHMVYMYVRGTNNAPASNFNRDILYSDLHLTEDPVSYGMNPMWQANYISTPNASNGNIRISFKNTSWASGFICIPTKPKTV